MTDLLTLPNTLENLEAEYYFGTLAEVQNLPLLAVLYDEIERLKADRKLCNLYAELNMCMVKHDEAERVYYESVAQMNDLNERIIAQKKLIENDYLLKNEMGME